MNVTEIFLIAMSIIFTVPYLIWRLGKTDYYAPLVVVQIITGILLGPGVLGAIFPGYYKFVFNPQVISSLNGIAWWAVMVFVMIAGVELDLKKMWTYKRESGITAGLALGVPLLFGCGAAVFLLSFSEGWMGPNAYTWQFILGVGMSCAVTALPILILLMEKLDILRQPIGQRILRYASLDDVAIWGVLALILLDWTRVGRQGMFLLGFAVAGYVFRRLMSKLQERDRWYVSFIWLAVCGYFADWSGLHFMVGAFLAGVVMDGDWFNQADMDKLRHFVLMIIMPVFFLSTGLRTNWQVGGATVFIAAAVLLIASVAGKLAGVHAAGKILKWEKGEASIVGWLLQTKALIMIIFANVLLDKQIITSETFTALLIMAVASTMLTVPMVAPKLQKMKEIIFRVK
jgi:Kef-type K+ transport system membrane component KefB